MTLPPSTRSPVWRFGSFELDPATGELTKAGAQIKLPPQPARVLAMLVSRAGRLVTREELRQELWGDKTFVDFELGLNFCLNRIRAALGDDARSPRYIETLPRRGYRLIAAAEPVRLPQTTIAVLPFDNLNRDAEQDFLAEGVADALTTELGNIGTLRVISRQSVLHLKGSQKTVPEIARELKADVIAEGSVIHAGGRVRITAQLILVEPEQHLWAKAYECGMQDILTTQGQVARAIAEAIQVVLTPAEMGRLGRPRAVDPEAHIAYLKGRHHMGRWSREGFQKGLQYFHVALQRDPDHALACAHLADCYALLGYWGHLPVREAFPQAKEAALKALALDDALSTAHWVLGWVSWLQDWDLTACEREVLRAIQLNPSDEEPRIGYSMFLATAREDRAGAVREAGLALDLAPLSLWVNASAGWVQLFVRDHERAIEQARRTIELFPDSLQAHYVLGSALVAKSRYPEAIAAFEKAVAISRDAMSIGYLGHANARAGNTAVALSLLDELLARSEREYVQPRSIVLVYAGLGDVDDAFMWLEKAYLNHDATLFWMRVMPLFDPLRRDPRFDELMRRVWRS